VLEYDAGDLNAALVDANRANQLDGADERVADLRKMILEELASMPEEQA
jgi:hypothetical protein